jgi:hypothetical protein
MGKFIVIVICIVIVAYVLKGLVKSLITLLNRKSSSGGNNNFEKTDKKQAIPYDKSKVVDADYEDIK